MKIETIVSIKSYGLGLSVVRSLCLPHRLTLFLHLDLKKPLWASIMTLQPINWVLCFHVKGTSRRAKTTFFFLHLPRHRFKNICVHTDPLKMTENAVVHIPGARTGGLRFRISPPWDPFSKKCVFRRCVFRIRMDGRPKRCNTCAFSQNGVVVWTGPKFGRMWREMKGGTIATFNCKMSVRANADAPLD